jgi:hypothetical protein
MKLDIKEKSTTLKGKSLDEIIKRIYTEGLQGNVNM